jgi:hypothetical protein
MIPSMSRILILLVLSLAALNTARASSFYVSASGTFSGSDVSGPLVSPNGKFSLSFTVDSAPTPVPGSVSTLGFDVPVYGFYYSLKGTGVAANPSEVRFNTSANGGLFDVTFGSGLAASEFVFSGAQAFSGTTTAPVFSTGQYAISNWTFSDPANYDSVAPLNSAVSITPVPEPSSGLFLVCGSALIAIGLHRRSRTA